MAICPLCGEEEIGFQHSTHKALLTLYEDGASTPRGVWDAVGEPPSLLRILNILRELERRGHVERLVDEARGGNIYRLTDRGEDHVDAILERKEEAEKYR